MNPERFDDLVFSLGTAPSRRSLIRALGTGVFTAMLATFALPHGAAAACKNDNAKCRKDADCCSGACKGKKRKRKCRASTEARGCTIDDPYSTPCPDATNASQYCWVTLGGKPFCGTGVKCFACTSNEHCVQEVGNPSARCVVTPDGCSAQFNFRSCVVYP